MTKRAQGSLPAGFEPAAHPVIARHFFGGEPFPIAQTKSEVIADLRFRRQCQRLHALGNRAMTEFLAELGAERSIMTLIDQKLDTYAELDPETLEATGGDEFWPVSIREVHHGS